jgi:two-component system, LytTR family, response regulator LytT
MAKTKILIVEDENIVAKDLESILQDLGYKVIGIVSNAIDAITMTALHKPNLVLMDIMIKGKTSGIEAAKEIKSKYDIPVVFLTAYADDKTIDNAKDAFPYGYIIKPFKEKELETTIEMAINKYDEDKNVKKERDLYHSLISQKSSNDSIFIRADYKLNKVKYEEIYFIEALKDYVVINTADNEFTTHTTMKEMVRVLPDDQFVRVHRSFIVRLDKIFSIKYPDLIIEGKMKVIPIGGLYRKELYDKLNLI